MPYIEQEDRVNLEVPSTPGELNYLLTELCTYYIARHNDLPRYKDYNDVIGALEACKLEFYRRAVAKYEDRKCKENGDVY